MECMNIVAWFSLFFSLFTALYYFVGMRAGRQTRTENDYFLAGRNLGFWSLTGTLLATQIGAGVILGTVDDAYAYGLPGLFYGLGIAIGFAVLGMGIAGMLRALNVSTTAEIFEKYFASPALKKWASLLSIMSLGGIFVAQVIASRKLMAGLGVENELLFLGFWAVLIGYTMYGGLPAVVATDLLQVTCIILVFVCLFIALWWQGALSINSFASLWSTHAMPAGGSFQLFFSYVGMPLLFSVVEQDLAQRFFSARSSLLATAASWASGFCIVLFALIPAIIGVQARLAGVIAVGGQSPLLLFIAPYVGPIGQALVMCALVAAIASTADSLLCAISSNVVQDFMPTARAVGGRMRNAEITTAVVGVAGVVGSYYASNILGVMIQSYELLVSSILVPVLMCIAGVRLRRTAALSAVCAGGAVYALSLMGVCGTFLPGSFLALVASLMAYGFGLLISLV